MKDFYATLGLSPDASPDEIKHAFREQIARYHPDKVHHLGKEFQQLAQTRAAELTEAYNTLADRSRRAEYDQLPAADTNCREGEPPSRPADQPAQVEPAMRSPPPPPPAPPREPVRPAARKAEPADTGPRRSATFSREQAGRDELVRRASLARLRDACKEEMGDLAVRPATGFDLSCLGRGGFFARLKNRPWVLGRYLPRMDADAVREAGESAARLSGPHGVARCVFLLSGRPGRVADLAETIADVRRRARARAGCDVLLVPVDVRGWQAYLPKDAPSLARAIVARLQS